MAPLGLALIRLALLSFAIKKSFKFLPDYTRAHSRKKQSANVFYFLRTIRFGFFFLKVLYSEEQRCPNSANWKRSFWLSKYYYLRSWIHKIALLIWSISRFLFSHSFSYISAFLISSLFALSVAFLVLVSFDSFSILHFI